MDNFTFANLTHRKTRSVVTMLGVSLGVVLLILTVGLARGQLVDRGRREAKAGAEIIVSPAGSGLSTFSGTLSFDLGLVPKIETIDGVEAVVPLAKHVDRTGGGGFGWRSIDGVNIDEYAEISGLQVVQGRSLQGPHEAIVDEAKAREKGGGIGGKIEFGGTEYTIVGVYSPESMSRIKIPLESMQSYFDAQGYASMALVKVKPGADQEAVARAVRDGVPNTTIMLSRDLPAFYSKGIPALNTFLNVVIGLSLTISTLVILLTMYTTVMERTRQIGILKSLGASRAFIAAEIEKEALVISLAGVAFGYLIALVAGLAIASSTSLIIEFEPSVFAWTGAIGLLSGVLGALYPAVRAANLDPVRALAYE